MMKIAKTDSSATVVDGTLILSLMSAQNPVVWQMDLAQAKASALEITPANDGQAFILSLKTPQGKVNDVATFESKDAALEGLSAAARALESAHGKIRGNTAANTSGTLTPQSKNSGWKKWIITVLILLGLWFAYSYIIVQIRPGVLNDPAARTTAQNMNAPALQDPRQSQGVPVSADDFLNR